MDEASDPVYAQFHFLQTSSSISLPISDGSVRGLIIVTIGTRSRLLGTTTVVPVMGEVDAPSPEWP